MAVYVRFQSPLTALRLRRPLATAPAAPPEHCPQAPAVNCTNVPRCTTPNATVELAGACNAPSGVSITYLVDGSPATSAACPSGCRPVVVSLVPTVTTEPGCVFNATVAFELLSEWVRQTGCVVWSRTISDLGSHVGGALALV